MNCEKKIRTRHGISKIKKRSICRKTKLSHGFHSLWTSVTVGNSGFLFFLNGLRKYFDKVFSVGYNHF